jgi:hypothetical protein
MASSSLGLMSVPTLQPITKKLTHLNFLIWKALVLSALKGAQLFDFLEGKIKAPDCTLVVDDKKTEMHNPEFAIYVAKQQQVFNFLSSSLSKEMLELVTTFSTIEEV